MMLRISCRVNVVSIAVLMALLGWPAPGGAQTVSGQARAIQATVPVIGTTTLADTGTLGSAIDAREASQSAGSIASLVSGEALHATTIGWPDQVASEASVADLALTIAGTTIGAGAVLTEAVARLGAAPAGTVTFDGLVINGMPVDSTAPNQTIYIPGGRIVVNEQIASAGGIVVNALHIVAGGVDVVIASASAGVR
jgi:hypothetical protein